jgi:hypothetical protein
LHHRLDLAGAIQSAVKAPNSLSTVQRWSGRAWFSRDALEQFQPEWNGLADNIATKYNKLDHFQPDWNGLDLCLRAESRAMETRTFPVRRDLR